MDLMDKIYNLWEWIKEEYKLVLILLTFFLFAIFGSEAEAKKKYEFPYPYASFHVVKGNTHSTYPCTGMDNCYDVFKEAQLARKVQCSDRFWIERTDGSIQILK
jgi:hypothetical protein